MATRTAALEAVVRSDVRDGVAGLGKVETGARRAGAQLDDTGRRSGRFSRILGSATKVAAGGLLAVGAAAISAGKAAAEDAAGQSRLAQTLRTGAGATAAQIKQTEAYITTQGKLLGVSDDELRPALGRLATATGSVEKAQRLASLAMNIAASTGKPLKTVTEALAKAQTGSLAGLSKLGVATKDASGHTKSLSTLTSELQSKYAGSAAKAAGTITGKQKILTVQLGELREQIGAKLLPVMSSLVSKGLEAVDWASKHTAVLKPLLIAVGVLTGLVLVTAAAQKVWTAGVLIHTAVTKGITVATNAWKAAQFLLNIALIANPIGVLVVAIVALIAIVAVIIARNEGLRRKLVAVWDAIRGATVGAVRAVVSFIRSHWPLLLAILTGPIGLAVLFIARHWTQIRNGASAAWDGIRNAIRTGVTRAVGVVRDLPGKIIGVFSDAGTWLLHAGEQIIQGLLDGIGRLLGKLKDKLHEITSLIPKLKGPLSKDRRLLRPAGTGIMEGLISSIEDQIPNLRRTLERVTSTITDTQPRLEARLALQNGLSTTGSSTPAGVTHITNNNVTVQGAVDVYSTGRQIRKILDESARVTG